MRTRDELERLAAAGRPLLSAAESLVDAGEEDRILARILASDRRPAPRGQRRRRAVLALTGIAVVAAAGALAALEIGAHRTAPVTGSNGHHRLALTGAKIELAGYRFRTPAGFTASSSSCTPSATGRFSAAASAAGGCVEAFFMLNTGAYAIPDGAEPIEVAGTHGYLVPAAHSLTLYAPLPREGEYSPYLMLVGKGLTADQLVAIAESGLPASPGPGTTTTCTENCG